MASRYFGTSSDKAELVLSDYVGSSSGGTLSGGQNCQVVFDDTVYTSAWEGKQRLIRTLEAILKRIHTARTWPIDSTS